MVVCNYYLITIGGGWSNMNRKAAVMSELEILDYCHDSDVEKISVRTDSDGKMNTNIHAVIHKDCGCERWNDKRFVVSLRDVLVSSYDLVAYSGGNDLLDGVEYEVSRELMDKVEAAVGAGGKEPKCYIKITFVSGSVMEAACDEIEVKMKEEKERQ